MIRTGRPAFHIKACSISFRAANGDIEYYELDKKGDLVRSVQKKIVPHHIVKFSNAQINPNQFQNNSFFQNSGFNYNQQQFYQQQQFQCPQYQKNHQYQQYQQMFQNQQQQLDQYHQQQPNLQQQNEPQENRQQSSNQPLNESQEQFSLFDTVNDSIEESSTLLFGMDLSNDSDALFFDLDDQVENWI